MQLVEEKAPGKNVQGIKCKKRVAVNKVQEPIRGTDGKELIYGEQICKVRVCGEQCASDEYAGENITGTNIGEQMYKVRICGNKCARDEYAGEKCYGNEYQGTNVQGMNMRGL